MKKTLLFTAFVTGLALAGCNRDKRTSTATATTDTAATTDTTTTTRADATSRDVSDDIRRGADQTAAATREAGRDMSAAVREAGREMKEFGRETSGALARAGDKIEAKFQEWKLNAKDIEADLAADRPIVRTKSDTSAQSNRQPGSRASSTRASASRRRLFLPFFSCS